MITVKTIWVKVGEPRPYHYEDPFVVQSPEEAFALTEQHDRVLFKDTAAPQVRNGILTPIAVYGITQDGFTHLTEYSFGAWIRTLV